MTQYGIVGFGTAAAYAEALGSPTIAGKRKEATTEIDGVDAYMNQLSETVNAEAEVA